jgi:hypothetical protein
MYIGAFIPSPLELLEGICQKSADKELLCKSLIINNQVCVCIYNNQFVIICYVMNFNFLPFYIMYATNNILIRLGYDLIYV